jgi:hypothetical protein
VSASRRERGVELKPLTSYMSSNSKPGRHILMGYISFRAAIALWLLGLIITSTVIYFVYSAAVQYVSTIGANQLVTALLLIAGVAILAFWGFVLSRGVSSGESK